MSTDRVRARDIEASDAGAARGALDDLFEGRLDALQIRGVYSPEAMARVTARLEARTTTLPWDDQHTILLVGTPLTPNYADPAGPALDASLSTASEFQRGLRELFRSLMR